MLAPANGPLRELPRQPRPSCNDVHQPASLSQHGGDEPYPGATVFHGGLPTRPVTPKLRRPVLHDENAKMAPTPPPRKFSNGTPPPVAPRRSAPTASGPSTGQVQAPKGPSPSIRLPRGTVSPAVLQMWFVVRATCSKLDVIGFKMDEPRFMEKRLHCRNILRDVQQTAVRRLGHDQQDALVPGNASVRAKQRGIMQVIPSQAECGDDDETTTSPAGSTAPQQRWRKTRLSARSAGSYPPTAADSGGDGPGYGQHINDRTSAYREPRSKSTPASSATEEAKTSTDMAIELALHRRRKRSRIQRLWKRLAGSIE
mmetsp:Transcript_29970/g.89674  ORF Transcript_29970/g.89674 Transcript_29970/m.89674 type:complete len:313 (-) Transcript_29970:208-1146(-)|eukprot:CAMPEP_0206309256 /NCGR_PEP_ID=MMETSP0106_2-20121207/12293_1 /ASSEMBLY_ACC=CAM_ASM_000206 /TAXON_ID=81532 /ORGANISM="Acanthoeca-like sp., Strain 10tr" /LENGTH=312 /DNA_ID=CAMNT_0053740345 /DNA_START=276 /DNA_END=1214 /DNA_ORIENTATION=+